MEWKQDLSVGVPQIDEQHKELIKRINVFFDSVEAKKEKEEVLKVLGFLESYVVTHFADEENLQKRVGYPRFPQHSKLHRDFVAEVKKLKADIENGGFTVMTKSLMSSVLINWLILHIGKEDKDIGNYMRANGMR